MEIDEEAWLLLRNMNDESTKKSFGLMKIDTLQDAKDFLTACKSALMQHTKNTTHRALIDFMGLHDVSLPVCEMMSLLGNKGIGSCVLKTSSSLYPRMKFILKSLPASSKALSKMRLQLHGWTWSQASIWTGKDTFCTDCILFASLSVTNLLQYNSTR